MEKIGSNINRYRSYPRIVGETGGKDFVVAHPTADPKEVATAVVRGAFEFQGQKLFLHHGSIFQNLLRMKLSDILSLI